MKHAYLSDAWFAMHDAMLRDVGAKVYKDVVANLTVAGPNGPLELSLHDGAHRRGHDPRAPITLTMPPDVAYSFVTSDPQALMVAVVNGTVTIDGDMEAFTRLSSRDRHPALQRALEKVLAKTAPPKGAPSRKQVEARTEEAIERLGSAMRAEARAARDAKRTKPKATAKPAKAKPAKAKPAKSKTRR